MNSLPCITYDEVAATPLGQTLGADDGRAFAARLERRVLSAGEVLFSRGDPGDRLYLVVRGKLHAVAGGEGRPDLLLGEIGPGELMGESDLLLGAPRSTTVQAAEPATVGALDAASWQDLRAAHPAVEAAIARAVEWRERTSDTRRFRPDASWVCAWLGRTELLAGVGVAVLQELERELMWETLPGGEVLVRAGDAGDCMWFVARGRLRASVRHEGGVPHVVGEIGAGECVGEMALLSGAPRSTTVKAVRDTELLRLPKSAFERLVSAHPETMLGFTRAVVARLQRVLGARSAQPAERTLALVAGGPGVPLAAFAGTLAGELSKLARTVVLDGTAATRDAAAVTGGSPEVVVFVCDPTLTPWSTRCLREADDVVVVGLADGDVHPGQLEREALAAAGRRDAGCHLVLLHRAGAPPSGTDAWLAARPPVRHHHVRPDRDADHARLARLLSGRAIGLALSGGGARGFAHIGVLRAIHEAGVPVDLIAGTSMGSMVAAVHALGQEPDGVLDRCRAWTRERPWGDFTLPLASIVRGRRVRRALTNLLGHGRIEDLWLPFACVTSNLTRATVDVHTAGPLAQLVLASNSVPGLAPPVFHLGEVLVDGGVMDNLPVAALRRMGAGRVIAVDVGTEVRVAAPPVHDECPSGWRILWDGLWRRPQRALPVFLTITRAFTLASDERAHAACRDADLALSPPLGTYASTDFKHIDDIAEMAFHYARERLAEWSPR
jgi:predicted acylesterase/phospholipase RssA/CRP-like cAMP-binding protein